MPHSALRSWRFSRPRSVLHALALFLGAQSCGGGGGDATGPSPITSGGVLPIGKAVTVEIRQVSVFWVKSDTTAEVAIYFRSPGGDLLVSYEFPSGGAALPVVPQAAGSPFRQRTMRFVLQEGDSARVELRPSVLPATIDMLVYPVNRRPEVAPVQLALGDTLTGEVLETNADVDEFEIVSPSYRDVSVFLQSLSGRLHLALVNPASGTILETADATADPLPGVIWRHRTRVRRLNPGATYRLTVSMDSAVDGSAYRLLPYPVNPLPEKLPSLVQLGATLTGEDLENPADVDSFSLAVPTDTLVIGSLASPPGLATLRLTVDGAIPRVYRVRSSGAADPESAATGRFYLGAGTYPVVIGRDTSSSQAGLDAPLPFVARFRPVARAPETAGAVIQPGDTITGEAIDYAGDLDEFTVNAPPGRYNVFLQAVAPNTGTLVLEADKDDNPLGTATQSRVGDSALADQNTGGFPFGQTGFRVRVRGLSDSLAPDRAGYRLFVYPINTAPEVAPATLTLGDSVTVESIEYPGDVDLYTLNGVPGDASLFRTARAGPSSGVLRLSSTGGLVVPAFDCSGGVPGLQTCWSGRLPLPTGPATLTVTSGLAGGRQTFRGGYTLRTWPVSDAPEGMPALIQAGEVRDEALDPPTDIDEHRFDYRLGDWFVASVDQHYLVVTDWIGTPLGVQSVSGVSTGPFEFGYSGQYRLRVGTAPNATTPATGPYQVRLDRYPTTPETAAGDLVPEDSIVTEAIDELGDLDEFQLVAPPGTELVVIHRLLAATGSLRTRALLPGDSLPLFQASTPGTGRFLMPAGGVLRLLLHETRFGADALGFTITGPYRLVARVVNRAPEVAAPALTRGVPITSEILEFEGDMDEFTFPAAAGDSLALDIALRNPGVGEVQVELVEPGTGNVLAGANTSAFPGSTGYITLPTTGSYVVRVQGMNQVIDRGAYELLLR